MRTASGKAPMHCLPPRHFRMRFHLPPIYPITDKQLARSSSHLRLLKELVRGGATLVQIRDKHTPPRELLQDLRRCCEFAHKAGITLLVNDRCDLVLSSGAAGVHLGQEDLPPESARAILGKGRMIGFSTHSLRQVRESLAMPIQYIGFGPVYRTATKIRADREVGLRQLTQACTLSSVPVVAIGGIDRDRIRAVLEAGAASAAIIAALMTARSIARQMEQCLAAAADAVQPDGIRRSAKQAVRRVTPARAK